MSTRYKGSVISSTAAASSSTAAYGVWKQSEVTQLINSAWPNNDPYWTSVSMLLHGDGTSGSQNNTFIDSSSNNFTITRNGTATQGSINSFGSIAPYTTAVDGGSAYFNGTPDSLSAPANAAYQFGTGDFTVEFWINKPAAQNGLVVDARVSSTAVPWALGVDVSNFPYFYDGTTPTSTVAITNNVWNHVAVVRTSGVLKIFVGGVQGYSAALAGSLNATGTAKIGGTAAYTIGYISNLRIVKGTAVYTTAFTPPTAPLTAISGTSLLLGFTNAGIVDNAMQNNLITVGTSQISTSVLKYGTGSMAFSGSGAWLTTIDKTSLQLGTGDFTIEGWVHVNAIGTAYAIVSKGAASTGWSVNITSGNKLQFSYTAANLTGATSLAANAWYYFAVVRSGSGAGNLVIYLNGTADATSGGAVTDNFNQTNILYVGASRTGTTPLNGYIDDLRITKGIARYTANFTAPQQEFPNQ